MHSKVNAIVAAIHHATLRMPVILMAFFIFLSLEKSRSYKKRILNFAQLRGVGDKRPLIQKN